MKPPTNRLPIVVAAAFLVAGSGAVAQPTIPTTRPASGAADIFLRAQALLDDRHPSPMYSNDDFPSYPPYGDLWEKYAADADVHGRAGRELARTARSALLGNWPETVDVEYLNRCRHLATEIADAALFADQHGKTDESFELIRDLLCLTDTLRGGTESRAKINLLVAIGIDAMMSERMTVIASDLRIGTTDQMASPDSVRAMIKQLMDLPLPAEQLAYAEKNQQKEVDPNLVEMNNHTADSQKRLIEVTNRCNSERIMAAMSLACHLYKSEKGSWPEKADDLVPAYLAKIPIDPWAPDGKTPFGYELRKGVLPDGSDRPLIFNLCESQDGVRPPIDAPQFGFYIGDGNNKKLRTGQFRDVVLWQPLPN